MYDKWEDIKKKIDRKRDDNNHIWKFVIKAKDFGWFVERKLISNYYRTSLMRKQKAIYFYIHKSASSSLRDVFEGKYEAKDDRVNPRNIHKFNDYFKFTFVRNPYSRIVSCYKDKIKSPTDKSKEDFINGMYKGFWNYPDKFYPNMSFKDFIKAVHSIPDKKAEEHFKSQYCFITNKKGELIPDYVGKVENIKEDFNKICKKIGINASLPTKNKNIYKKHYSEWYDEETKKLVTERYKEDLERFNYKFEVKK